VGGAITLTEYFFVADFFGLLEPVCHSTCLSRRHLTVATTETKREITSSI
jgi:hypothetical protein